MFCSSSSLCLISIIYDCCKHSGSCNWLISIQHIPEGCEHSNLLASKKSATNSRGRHRVERVNYLMLVLVHMDRMDVINVATAFNNFEGCCAHQTNIIFTIVIH